MSVITIGKKNWFSSPREFLTENNSATPSYVSLAGLLPAGVSPANVESFTIQCYLFRAVPDQYGNCDLAFIIRLPGYQGTAAHGYNDCENFRSLGEASAQHLAQGQLWESLGGTAEVPNVDGSLGLHWLCIGPTINSAAVWVSLCGFTTL